MQRHWDKLRKPVEPVPTVLTPGVWRASESGIGGLRVELVDFFELGLAAHVRLGHDDNPPIGVRAYSARQLAGFFSDIADQLEKKG